MNRLQMLQSLVQLNKAKRQFLFYIEGGYVGGSVDIGRGHHDDTSQTYAGLLQPMDRFDDAGCAFAPVGEYSQIVDDIKGKPETKVSQ